MSQAGDGQHLLEKLGFSVNAHAERLSVYNILGLFQGYARKNDKRPAYVSFSVNDDVVKNMKGDPKLTDLYLMVRIPRDIIDSMTGEVQTAPKPEGESFPEASE